MCIVFSGIVYSQFDSYIHYAEEEEALFQQLAKEEKLTEDLKRQQEFYGSEAYIEKIAREKLRMVKPDEWVIVNDHANK